MRDRTFDNGQHWGHDVVLKQPLVRDCFVYLEVAEDKEERGPITKRRPNYG